MLNVLPALALATSLSVTERAVRHEGHRSTPTSVSVSSDSKASASAKNEAPAALKKDPVAELLKVDPKQAGELTEVAEELSVEIKTRMAKDPAFKKKLEKEVAELTGKDGRVNQDLALERLKSGRYNDVLSQLPPTLQFKLATAIIKLQQKAASEKQ